MLHKKLFNFEIQKCGQILCAHKTHFLMPGHIFNHSMKNSQDCGLLGLTQIYENLYFEKFNHSYSALFN